MTEESNKKFWNKFAKIYAPFMNKDKGVYDQVCRYIYPYLNSDMDILEVACGSGQLSFNLSKYTKSWIATDFSEQMIIEARKRGKYEKLVFEIADATSLRFEDEKFDGIVIANALHIMPDPDRAMREIHRVLKSNGILFAPTFLWKEGKQNNVIKKLMSIVGFKMYKEWDKNQFEEFVKEYGFSVVEMKLVYGGLAPVGVIIAYKKQS